MALRQYGQEGLNSSVPLTQAIYKNYEILSEHYLLFTDMPSNSHLPTYGLKHAKI